MLGLSPAVILPLVALVGILVGVAASFTGLGGGFLMVPLLMLGGLAKDQAVGTSFLGIFVISISAVVAHDKLKHVDRPVGLLLGVGGAAGAQVGARLLGLVSERSFKQIFAVALGLLALRIVMTKRRAAEPQGGGSAPGGSAPGGAAPSADASGGAEPGGAEPGGALAGGALLGGAGRASEASAQGRSPTLARGLPRVLGFLGLGLLVGVAAAFSGLGGGFLMVPATMMLGMSAAQAVGTSFLGILVISCSALVAHFSLANVDLGLGLAFGIGGIGGAQLGARLVKKVPQQIFQWIFGAILVALAARMWLA